MVYDIKCKYDIKYYDIKFKYYVRYYDIECKWEKETRLLYIIEYDKKKEKNFKLVYRVCESSRLMHHHSRLLYYRDANGGCIWNCHIGSVYLEGSQHFYTLTQPHLNHLHSR